MLMLRMKFVLVLTFVDVDDVGVLDRGHDLDLSANSDQVRLRLDLALLDRLDRHLRREITL